MGRYDRYYDEKRYTNPYKDYDWDNDGFPGEFVYGDRYNVDPEYGEERWKRVDDFPDYWVSDMGRMYSTIKRKFITGSPGKKGHIDLSLRKGGKRHHRYMHRIAAETFMENPYNLPLVRHLDDDPSNNAIDNLAFGTQADNMDDCIKAGRFKHFTEEDRELAMQKRRTPVTAVNLKTGEEIEYISQQAASRDLHINQASISDVIHGLSTHARGYYFYFTNDPKPIDFRNYRYYRHGALIKAIDLHSGEEYVFRGQTKAAMELGMSVSSISVILSGKKYQSKGYTFKYVEEDAYV